MNLWITLLHMPTLNLPLKIALLETGKKQKRVAKLLRIPEPTLSKIVRGHQSATEDQRKALAEFLNRDVNELFPNHAA